MRCNVCWCAERASSFSALTARGPWLWVSRVCCGLAGGVDYWSGVDFHCVEFHSGLLCCMHCKACRPAVYATQPTIFNLPTGTVGMTHTVCVCIECVTGTGGIGADAGSCGCHKAGGYRMVCTGVVGVAYVNDVDVQSLHRASLAHKSHHGWCEGAEHAAGVASVCCVQCAVCVHTTSCL